MKYSTKLLGVKLSGIALTVMVLATSCQTAAPSQPAAYRGGPQRTGLYDTQGVPELVGIKWQFETQDEVWSSPVIAGGIVYFGSDDAHLYAVDVETGQEKWRFKTEGDVRSSPAIANGAVYFTSFDGHIYAVDIETGQQMWKLNTIASTANLLRGRYDDFTSSPLVVDGVVYVGSVFDPIQVFYALDAQTGQEKWHFEPEGIELVYSSPAISGDTIYFGGQFHHLYAVDTQTGEQKWAFPTRGVVNYAPAIGDDGTVYFGSKDTLIYAVDGQTGEEKWTNNLAGMSWVTSSPAIANGIVYAGTSDGYRLHAIQMDTGEELWAFKTGGWVWSSPAFAEEIVYIGSADNHLYAVDAQTGQELWNYETGDSVYSSPLVANGVVYVGSTDGSLYALH